MSKRRTNLELATPWGGVIYRKPEERLVLAQTGSRIFLRKAMYRGSRSRLFSKKSPFISVSALSRWA